MEQRHPDAERLAEYADRTLDAAAVAAVEAHLAQCADCRVVLAGTAELLGNEERTAHDTPRVVPFVRRRAVLGAAAALAAAAVLVIAIWTGRPDRTEFDDLVAAVATETVRPLEGRLVGFPHAPAPAVTRAPNGPDLSPAVRIAAAAMERHARREGTAVTGRQLGVAYAVAGDLDNAVNTLERATAQPDAMALSDLSAVYLRRGRVTDRREDYEKALVAADRALAADPSLREACFNHALALEYLTRVPEADSAWRGCLSTESDPVWAAEIRSHLDR